MKFLKYLIEQQPVPPAPANQTTNSSVTTSPTPINPQTQRKPQITQPAWQAQQRTQRISSQPFSQQQLDNFRKQLSLLPQYKITRLLYNLNALKPTK